MTESVRPPETNLWDLVRWLVIALVVITVVSLVVALINVLNGPVEVPDLRLERYEDASAILAETGLTLGEASDVATDAVAPGRIAGQSPAAGTEAPRGSSVDVVVAVEPTLSRVPDVSGLDEAGAEAMLAEALFTARTVGIFDAASESGTVIGQAPPEGTQWMTGEPVAIAVSAGPDDGTGVAVPDVRGFTPVEAATALDEAGLLASVFATHPSAPDTAVVVGQLPDAGVLVRPGTSVLLLFDLP